LPGIYFHIPFCKQACHYCNFHFSTSLKNKEEMLDAMIREQGLVKKTSSPADLNEEVDTIYFGGGTPSMLEVNEIKRFLDVTRENFNVSPDTEITLEANPDDITEEKLSGWRSIGINRFSIGIQSFVQDDLAWMNRAHNAQQALRCIELVKAAGFCNFSVDLIFGTPTLTDEDWKKNVQTIIDLDIPHISCYALTVEPGTALQKMIGLKKKAGVDADKQASQFLLLIDWLTDAGYEHYEISNFAKPGFRSRHNSSYWQGKKYIGIGPSAHSFDGGARRWNISNNALYCQAIKQGTIPFQEEKLTDVQQLNEYIMTALRTSGGIGLDHVEDKFGAESRTTIESAVTKYITSGKLIKVEKNIILTREGKLFADGIAAELFFDP
jgi:oxygen-independent coproporphyrinogen-3 oxidase